jgi:hypothetical protein
MGSKIKCGSCGEYFEIDDEGETNQPCPNPKCRSNEMVKDKEIKNTK